MNRRDFIRLMGIASSTSLLHACGLEKGSEKLIPYLVPPEDGIIPGEAVYYSTTCMECTAACGVSVRVREGSPVKLEGLSGHPVNDGALCVRGQAAITRLYHPERLEHPLIKSGGGFKPSTWDAAFARVLEGLEREEGKQHFFLSGRTTGILSSLIDDFCRILNIERLPEFEMLAHANLRKAYHLLFGRGEIPFYKIEKADFLLTVGADILETFVSPVSYPVQVRRARDRGKFKWFHIEPHVSLTGLQAGKRFVILPGSEVYLLFYLLHSVAASRGRFRSIPPEILVAVPKISSAEVTLKTGLTQDAISSIEQGLLAADSPLLITGGVSTAQSTGLEAAILTSILQWATGQIPSTISFSRAEGYERVGSLKDVKDLAGRMSREKTGVILVTRTDPLACLHGAFSFEEAFAGAALRVGCTDLMTPTMEACDVVMPLSHPLESWGDVESRKGITSIIQPAIEPIYDSLPEGDILLGLLRRSSRKVMAGTFQEYLFKRWKRKHGDSYLEELINRGYFDARKREEQVHLNSRSAAGILAGMSLPIGTRGPAIIAVDSIRNFDGRSARLALLNEIPDPLTTISYGDWISVPEEVHGKTSIQDGEVIAITLGERTIKLPAKVQPGLPKDIFMVQGSVVAPPFFDVDERSGEAIRFQSSIQVARTGAKEILPILSGSTSQEGRGVIPDPEHIDKGHRHERQSFYPELEYKNYHWTMVIDLDCCTGCSACVAACYIENNVPVVGKVEHLRGRELSWLRVEPYYEDDRAWFLPMMCQHCDSAPCESVCPVYATYHNPEGLNAQIYNRCVGTRYCSNNCPYKVRRFNWFDPGWEGLLERMLNPDVSVREKGVMEKCTFCLQRIRAARDKAKDEGRHILEGEVNPACAQTCPARAIHFGNLLDEKSVVYKLAHSQIAYRVFDELGTEPSVYYLRKRGAKDDA